MKALILAGGRGKRFNSSENSINKCLTLCNGKPLIQYSLENAVAVGVDSIVVVVGHRAEDIINRFGTDFHGKKITYVLQYEQRGLVHAMVCAKDAIGDSDFMLFLADEVIIAPRHQNMLDLFHNDKLFVACGTAHVEDLSQISKTYALMGDSNTNQIFRLIEKPRVAINNIMGTGNCVMRSDIFKYIDRTPINVQRNEKELPDLIQCAIDEGQPIKHFDIGNGYFNINTPEDITLAEEYIKQIKLI